MSAKDYSLTHKPVSDLFPRPDTKAEWSSYGLSDAQITDYREMGFTKGGKLLDDEQLEALRRELSELFDPAHPANGLFYEYHENESEYWAHNPDHVLFHAIGGWRTSPGFHDLLWHPGFTAPSSQLLGGGVRLWTDQLFCKPARHGDVVAWHQDYSYWTRTVPMCHLTCWIALDDATEESGCLHYIPGSHRWDLLPITGLAANMDAIQSVLTEEQKDQFTPFPMELKAGECVFHHPLTVHGSFQNHTDGPRRAIAINAFVDGTVCDQDPPVDCAPPIPIGEPMSGQFYPLLTE